MPALGSLSDLSAAAKVIAEFVCSLTPEFDFRPELRHEISGVVRSDKLPCRAPAQSGANQDKPPIAVAGHRLQS